MKHTTTKKSTKLGLVFCFLVFILVALALLYKGIVIYKNSIYNDTHRFTILILNSEAKQEILSFDPEQKKLAKILVTPYSKVEVSKLLHIPTDSSVSTSFVLDYSQPVSQQFKTLLTHYPQIKTRMTIIDLTRLYFLSKTILPQDSSARTISKLRLNDSDNLFLHDNFSDSDMVSEGKTVQIINASGISGVGGDVEKMITQMGGSVIAVNTGREDQDRTTVQYSGGESYTITKFKRFFTVPIKPTSEHSFSDIIITLGRDHPYLIN